MTARANVARLCILLVTALLYLPGCAGPPPDFSEATIADVQLRMQRGELSAEQLVAWYLERIAAIDQAGPALNSIIEVNPDALAIARALDAERRDSGPRGPLHGIPVVLKANIDTADAMITSAGSLALAGHIAPDDAFIVGRLRAAGAVILGKANLSEWANFRSRYSSSGWSSVGGQTRNPYDLLRNPCGSSSGSAVAVAANLTMLAVGTETNGSVVCPSGANGVVGIKPTLGLVSRDGIIPIAHSQDTAGPMARSVRDAAILLGVLAGFDAADPATTDAPAVHVDFASGLAADALQGKRLGVIRNFPGAGHPAVEPVLAASIATLRAAGAEIVDGIEIEADDMYAASRTVLLYEFKADLKSYFEQSGAPLQTLEELIRFNEQNRDAVMPFFGQDRLLAAQATGTLDDAEYREALATSKRVARSAIDGALAEHDLDALIAPTNGPAWYTDHVNGDKSSVGSSALAAISGYPNITVPAGFASGLPIGLSIMGGGQSDRRVIEIAHAFEQASQVRRPPEF